ncbi:uncharacterized protein BO80DRAFT_459552 [Aspergillus ibericus CBS 121593]|uniref:Uncharacterized protein n=1 Tax=Aspergillus ibericus CBS 121593 TaxID=1448316 RepID=A0A395GLM7_9EURO|nr:hypothetical protein BO80DRAFT_459552 [Aspergillus ibericus CBS 121593]RAK95727.1 hypothetical protein BO80DRAFT_459552 [Aspergillus ibericus CBS 121593]
MSGTSLSTARSGSAQSHLADPPTSDSTSADPCFDTALPPMSSKQLVVSTRRPPRGSESSLIANSLRGNNRAVTALQYSPGTTTIARGPSTHRRTGSTLKTVMRKIFTRKSRGHEDGDEDPAPGRFGNQSPRSDRSFDKPLPLSGSLNGKSISPLQHETGPVTSWEEALQKLEPHPRRRRATLPSLIFSDDESRGALEAVVNSDRPTSKRDNNPHANSDPDEARRREVRQIKRRSRSATALRGMAKDHLMSPIQWRRRSLESYAGSTTFGAPSEVDASERPPTRTTVASAPKPTTEPSFLEEADEEDEDEEEVQEENIPPMVGTLVNSLQHDENVTLEQRLTTLEVKLIDLECAIARMQCGRSETPAETSGQKKSPTTSRHKRKQSSARSPSGGDEAPNAKSPGADRPLSTSTLRPNHLHRSRTLQAPSSTSLHECNNAISVEQYSALVMLLRREQSARRQLEEQVSSLRGDVEQLTRMARESMGPMHPVRTIDPQDIIRMRQALGPSPTNSAPTEKLCPGDSDSEERPELPPKGDVYHPRWPSARRVEVGGMI